MVLFDRLSKLVAVSNLALVAAPILIAVILLLLFGNLDHEVVPVTEQHGAEQSGAKLATTARPDGSDRHIQGHGESSRQTKAQEVLSSTSQTDILTGVTPFTTSIDGLDATRSESPDEPPFGIQEYTLDGFDTVAMPTFEEQIDYPWLRSASGWLGTKAIPESHRNLILADHERWATAIQPRQGEQLEALPSLPCQPASLGGVVAPDRVDDFFVSDDEQLGQTDNMEQEGRAFAKAFPANYPIDDGTVILAQAVEPDGGDGGEERGAGAAGDDDEEEEYGIPPPRRVPLFLQETSVLLPPGEYQYETGLRYSTNSIAFPVTAILDGSAFVANANQKQQTISMPLEFRFGIAEELQGFVSIPLGWSKQRTTFQSVERAEDRVFGIGDLSLGLTKLLWQWKEDQSRLLGSISASAPTGPSAIAIGVQQDIAALGRGYWTVGGGLNLVKSIDPISIFGGTGYTYTFATDIGQGQKLDAGNSLYYSIGLGYSVNPTVSLNVAFAGSYGGELQLNGNTIPGSATEPLSLKIAATFANVKKRTLLHGMANKYTTPTLREPYVRFGLTQFAGDVDFGIRITY